MTLSYIIDTESGLLSTCGSLSLSLLLESPSNTNYPFSRFLADATVNTFRKGYNSVVVMQRSHCLFMRCGVTELCYYVV
jgi:hypothetical protein